MTTELTEAQPGLPHDIRGLLPYSPPWWVYALGLLVAAALIAGLVFAVRAYMRRRRSRPPVPVDPWDALTARLKSLAPDEPFGRERQEEFFFQLSLLLREAIELRTQLRATDLTCQELKEPLRRKLPLAREATETVVAFLERADLVKFAGAPSDAAEARQWAAEVGHWLRALTPRSIDQNPFDQAPIAQAEVNGAPG